MRTSSMKSRIAVTTLFITLTLAAPRLDAKAAQPHQSKNRGAIAVVTQLIQRYFGITSMALPGEPWPSLPSETTTSTFAPKDTVRP